MLSFIWFSQPGISLSFSSLGPTFQVLPFTELPRVGMQVPLITFPFIFCAYSFFSCMVCWPFPILVGIPSSWVPAPPQILNTVILEWTTHEWKRKDILEDRHLYSNSQKKKKLPILNPFFSILISDTRWKFLACLVIMSQIEHANPGLNE